MYSVAEKVWLVENYKCGSLRAVCDLFHENFPESPKPAPSTLKRLIERFRATGNVSYQQKGIPKPRQSPNDVLVLAAVAQNPHVSSRAISQQGGPSQSAVVRTLKRHGFKSYHTSIHQELRPGDAELRFQFASTALEISETNPEFFESIIFTDESSFWLHTSPNCQNYRQWATSHPHSVYRGHTQYPQRLNCWAGIVANQIIGPIFIDGTLTGEKYLQMLENDISERIADLDLENELWFMHDGAPPHQYHLARDFLHTSFPLRVIGKREEPLAWPPRSPDLNPCDSFLWGHIKSTIYRANPFANLETLQGAIERCCDLLSPIQLHNVTRDFETRLRHCVAAEGDLFEHLL